MNEFSCQLLKNDTNDDSYFFIIIANQPPYTRDTHTKSIVLIIQYLLCSQLLVVLEVLVFSKCACPYPSPLTF